MSSSSSDISEAPIVVHPPSTDPVTTTTSAGPPAAPAAAPAATDAAPALAVPAGHELKTSTTQSSEISISSQRELKPKREKEWREAFETEASEELVETHGCALAKDILVHGRIYVSHKKIYFKSNILGFKTLVDFAFSSVVSIEPKMTARVIPNAIEIALSGGETYMFTTLATRDETLDILLALWRAANPEAFSAYTGRKGADEAAEYRARAASVTGGPPPEETKTINVSQTSSAGDHAETEATQAVPKNPPAAATASDADAPAPSSDGSATSHPETHADSVEEFEEACMDIVIPVEPKKLFDLWYRDDSFITPLWDQLGFIDSDCVAFAPGQKTRDYSYVKPLKGSFGPSSTKCVFHDEITHEDPDQYISILTVTQTPNVPSGKTFQCKSMTTFTWAGDNRGTRVRATSEVEFLKNSMMLPKGMVKSSSVAGQKEYNAAIERHTREYLKEHPELLLAGSDNSGSTAPTPAAPTDSATSTGRPQPEKTVSSHTKPVSPKKMNDNAPAASLFDAFLEDPTKLVLLSIVLLLLLSNTYLFFSRPVAPLQREFKGAKHEARTAMERLDRMEREWDGLRSHFGGAVAQPAIIAPAVVADTQPVQVESVPSGRRRRQQ